MPANVYQTFCQVSFHATIVQKSLIIESYCQTSHILFQNIATWCTPRFVKKRKNISAEIRCHRCCNVTWWEWLLFFENVTHLWEGL